MTAERLYIELGQVVSPALRARLSLCVAQLDLSQRTINCLDDMGIITVNDLLQRDERRLRACPGIGEAAMEEIFQALELIGFVRSTQASNGANGRKH